MGAVGLDAGGVGDVWWSRVLDVGGCCVDWKMISHGKEGGLHNLLKIKRKRLPEIISKLHEKSEIPTERRDQRASVSVGKLLRLFG